MKQQTKNIIIGLAALVAANVIWGVMAPICKDLFNTGLIDGTTISAIRIVACTVIFWLLTPFVQESRKFGTLEKKDVLPVFIIAPIFMIGTQTLTNVGVQYTYPIDAAVCCSTTPIFTLLLGAIFYYHKFPSLIKILGVLMGLAGVVIFIMTTAENPDQHVDNPVLGDALCVLSQVCGAIYLVFFVGTARKYSAFTLMKWLYTFSLPFILPFTFKDIIAVPWGELSAGVWFDVLYIVILGSFVGYLLIPFAQQKVTPTVIAMCNYLQPITTAIYAIILGMAVITGATIIATLLIFVGVWFVNKESKLK